MTVVDINEVATPVSYVVIWSRTRELNSFGRVLGALEETEGGRVDLGNEQSRQRNLSESAAASQRATDLAHQRYEGGAAVFLSVLNAERALLEAQDRLAASQTRTVTALIAVYKAFGGGVSAMETDH